MSFSILPERQALGAAEQIQSWTTAVNGTGECKLTDVLPCFEKNLLALLTKQRVTVHRHILKFQ